MIHVFIGTKAQYIKTAPLLRRMDSAGIEYRLIDSGQHASLSASMRDDLEVRTPDVLLGGEHDVTSIPQAVRWAIGLARYLLSARRIQRDVFGDQGGVCVVHGDTPSTLISTLMAKRAGLAVAHLEAGLRSHNVFNPFPEELVRILVMRRADLLFAPDQQSIENLEAMGVEGEVVALAGNTSLEAVRHVSPVVDPSGPVIVTMHRVENLHRATRRDRFVDLVERIAGLHHVWFVLHEPTKTALGDEPIARLSDAGVEITPLTSHAEFVHGLARAPFVVTDGGSIQEECALLGVPTLLWRQRTERPNGLGANVVLSHYQVAAVEDFLSGFESLRVSPVESESNPTDEILEALLPWH